MKKWFLRKYLEFRAAVLHHDNRYRLPLEDKLDDYADEQIAMLLVASNEYRKAKKDPDAFVEKYFSAKIKPIHPFTDSWISDWNKNSLTLDWHKKDESEAE